MARTTHLHLRHRGLIPADQLASGTSSAGRVPVADGAGSQAWTAPTSLTVRDEDGTPTVANVTTIRVTNGTLTDNGGGSVSISITGGGGATGWEDVSTTGVRLEAGRTDIWDAAELGLIFMDSGFISIESNGASIEFAPDNGQVVDIVSGDGLLLPELAADPTAVRDGHILYNTATDRVRASVNGAWRDLGPGGIARIVGAAAIANTETVVTSFSMPAGFMMAGTTFRIRAYGRLTTGATGGSSIFRCRIGTTTLTGNIPATLTIANAALVTNAPFVLDMLVTVRTAGAGGTAIGNASVNGGIVGAFTAIADVTAISATVVVDTTATKLVELTFISGNAGSTATFENAVIEVVYA